jgi:hypothetical protein
VRGGDVATHMHLDTGNNAYFDQYFGDDGKYVKLANTGEVVIGSDDAVGNSASWTFGTDGTTLFPGGDILAPINDSLSVIVQDQENDGWAIFNVVTDGANTLASTRLQREEFRVTTDQAGVPRIWNFDQVGRLNLPGNINGVYAGNTSFYAYDDGTSGSVELKTISYVGDVLGSNIRVTQSNATISTANAAYTWNFDSAGNLTVPGGGAVFTIGTGTISVTANTTSGNAYLGLADASSAATLYGNAGVQIGTIGGNWDFDTAGNLSAPGNVSATGNVTGAYIVGNGSVLTSITGANVTGTVANATYATTATSATTAATVTTAAQPNITSVGTLTSVTVTGTATLGNLITSGASGNIFGANNISANTFSASGNVNAGGLTINGTGVVTGNLQVQGNLIYNNLTNITTANLVFGLANTTTGISANGAGFVVGNTAEASFLYNYSTQAWNSNIGISATGNVSGGNLVTAGNVSGNYILGNGALLTGVITSVANINSGTSNVTVVSSGGNVAVGVGGTPNVAVFATTGEYITGVLSVSGNANVGNIGATNVVATNLTGTLQTAAQTNITSVGTLGALTVTGNVTGGNLVTAGKLSATGNANVGNIGATNGVFSGALTGITTLNASGNANVGNIGGTNAVFTNVTGTLTTAAQPNITSTGTLTSLTVTGNVTGGNITTAGQVSATGNITTANSFVGNLVGTTVSITGNISAGNVIVNGQPTTYGVVTPVIVSNTSPNLNSFSNGTSTSPATTVFTLSIPSAGTWQLESWIRTFSTTGTPLISGGFYTGGTLVANSETLLWPTPVTNANGAGYMSAVVTTTGAATYTVGLYASATGVGLFSDSTGRTKATATLLSPTIAVQATATGTINNQYASITNGTDISITTGVAKDVTFDTVTASSGIPYSTSTGVFTLTSGVTYRFTGELSFAGYTGYALYQLVDATTNTPVNNQTSANPSYNSGFAEANNNTYDAIYTPSTNQTVKFRVTGSSFTGTGVIRGGYYGRINVQQINNAFALNALATMSLTGNITTTGNVSATGNVYGTNLTDKTSSSWTVTTGSNTYSITVPINGNYQIWVRCNIPNGIFAYQATVSVTNTNVPVLGTQRAYNYTGGGSPILLTTMPTQIVGAEGTISTAVVATTTANRFDFVINNTSGSSQTVYWGYVTL